MLKGQVDLQISILKFGENKSLTNFFKIFNYWTIQVFHFVRLKILLFISIYCIL